MSCSMEKVLGDARTLLDRLKEHDTAAETLIEQSSVLSQKIHSMKEYMEESTEYQELSRYKPHVLLTQENTQIKDLQHENKELWLSLEEHQYALELIMGRYRKQMLQLMMEKKELDTKPVLSLHQDHAKDPSLSKSRNATFLFPRRKKLCMLDGPKEVQSQLERICEMGQVMRQAVQMDDQRFCSVKERLAQLEIENKELRGLLSISNISVRPHREETNPAEKTAESPKKQET